ncbi:MAG: LacI family DNA-binding transcriptional regulator [Anaerolineae bacterium]|nr:LacI family DNA-binding transcriptional regulator [Anaerolineae bacterium]
MPVTMRDVAKEAGVSIKTVSRVVNNQGEITDSTRERVLAVIERLGYRPNLIARGLVTQRTYTIGLNIQDITNPFFPEVARGVQDMARAHNYNVFLCNSDDDPQEEIRTLQTLADQSVDGIISFPNRQSTVRLFAEENRPFVLINSDMKHPHVSQVMTNNFQGAKLAVDHLATKGHTEIGMITGQYLQESQRVLGFEAGLKAHGLTITPSRFLSGMPKFERGIEATHQLLTEHPEISAIFTFNDLLAAGAIQACKKLGRRVPDDCAIIGFDDTQLASLIDPPLTSVRLPKYEIGQVAMQRLLEMLEHPDQDFPPIHLDVELIVREST